MDIDVKSDNALTPPILSTGFYRAGINKNCAIKSMSVFDIPPHSQEAGPYNTLYNCSWSWFCHKEC